MAKTRVEEVVGRHALRTIQSADDDAMYVAATAAATYMATAGFLEKANGLLGRLWSYNWPHSRNGVILIPRPKSHCFASPQLSLPLLADGGPCGGLPMALASLVPRPVSYPRCGRR